METKPPFTLKTATQKVRMADDAWNSRDPNRVIQVYTEDTRWRNRAEFPIGRAEVHAFLQRKWAKELDYRLTGQRLAIASLCVLPTNGMMQAINGFVVTAMKIGSLTSLV